MAASSVEQKPARRFPKRLMLAALCALTIAALFPGWVLLTGVTRAELPMGLLEGVAQWWRQCGPPPGASVGAGAAGGLPLASPWSLVLLAADAGGRRHGEFLRQLHEEMLPLTEQLQEIFPGGDVELLSRYHTPLDGELSPERLSSAFQVHDWIHDVSSQRPRLLLAVYFSDRDPAPYAAFTVGSTAAVAIVHCKTDGCNSDAKHPQIASTVAALFSRQVRALFGLQTPAAVSLTPLPLSPAELRQLRTRSATESVHQTIRLLSSLGDIAESMPHMEVKPHIRQHFLSATAKLHVAIGHLCSKNSSSSGAQEALSAGLQSVEEARLAYFDPTLVAMLYFPAEHTLAVYGSMFLTLLITVLAALFSEIKHCRARSQSVIPAQ